MDRVGVGGLGGVPLRSSSRVDMWDERRGIDVDLCYACGQAFTRWENLAQHLRENLRLPHKKERG